MSQLQVWGAAFASLLAWIMVGIMVHKDEGPGYAVFVVASGIIFISLLFGKPNNIMMPSKENILIENEMEAQKKGVLSFWKVLHEIVAQNNLPECPLAIVYNDPCWWQASMLRNKNNRYYGVWVTAALIWRLDETELKAVVAHEIEHANDVYDGRSALFIIDFASDTLKIFGHAFLIVTLFYWSLCKMGHVEVSVDLASIAIVYWCSTLFGFFWGPALHALVMQEREIRADARGSVKMGSVEPLIRALTKIDSPRRQKTFLKALLTQEENTHPLLDERIRHLRRIQKIQRE